MVITRDGLHKMILFVGPNQISAGRFYWFTTSWRVYEALKIKATHKIIQFRVSYGQIEIAKQNKVFMYWTKKIQGKI